MKFIFYKGVEFLVLFILIPVSFAISYSPIIKMIISIAGFFYVLFVLLKIKKNKIKLAKHINWKLFWKETSFKFLLIVILTILYMLFFDKENLFNVVLNKPKLWVFILFFYSVFSVYPQELIYRTFYFQRYKGLFKGKSLFIFVNAVVFSLGHIFFKNTLVIVLTFLGGLLFAYTFYKTKSTLLVSVEHAIYGCWLFTVGMGNILGFPT